MSCAEGGVHLSALTESLVAPFPTRAGKLLQLRPILPMPHDAAMHGDIFSPRGEGSFSSCWVLPVLRLSSIFSSSVKPEGHSCG